MKKYLIILLLPLLVFTISCEDDEPISNEEKIAGSYYLHSTDDSDSYEISGSYDSTSMILNNLSFAHRSEFFYTHKILI